MKDVSESAHECSGITGSEQRPAVDSSKGRLESALGVKNLSQRNHREANSFFETSE